MVLPEFEDSRLDDPQALAEFDGQLRHLASTGARIRIEAAHGLRAPDTLPTPRGVVIVGTEARLIRAVLEPVCPVPLIAWPLAGLPGWAGPLDVVVVLAGRAVKSDTAQIGATVAEASRRGCALLVAAPHDSAVTTAMAGRDDCLVRIHTGDPTATAVVVLALLHELGLGPMVNAEHAAEAADMVAEECTPHRDLSVNPAKDLACGLGDGDPLIWGTSVLAARAGRRLAEAIRCQSGRPALAADADELAQVLRRVVPRDLFADPFTDEEPRRPVLVILDDQQGDAPASAQAAQLRGLAERAGVRVCALVAAHGGDVDRYLTLLLHGLFGASYLGVGLGAEPCLMG